LRIAELSDKSGLPIATIKFYRREGLLPPGRSVRCNQVEYSNHHLFRLRLIRALVEIGALPLPAIRNLIEAIDDPERPSSPPPRRTPMRGARWTRAREDLLQLLATNGWRVRGEAEELDTVADVLSTFDELGHDLPPDLLAGYVRLARETVAVEMRLVRSARRTPIPPLVQIGVFYEKLFGALRRLAREDWHARRRDTRAAG
jgi:DNA-binding transcriptional MerR regulator